MKTTRFVPEGLCVYCGQVREPKAPEVPCASCGRDASKVRWEHVSPGQRDVFGHSIRTLLVAAPVGMVLLVAARFAVGVIPWSAELIAAIAIATIVYLALRFARTPIGNWSFHSDDMSWLGGGTWHDVTLTWASAHERLGEAIELPQEVVGLTSEGLNALDPELVASTLKEHAGLTAEGLLTARERSERHPYETLALAGMIARGELRGSWRKGWSRSTIMSPSWSKTQQLGLEEGLVSAAARGIEERVVSTLRRITSAPMRGRIDARGASNYRVASARSLDRIEALDAVLDAWDDEETVEDSTPTSAPDAERDERTLRALRALGRASPALVMQLLEIHEGKGAAADV